MEWIETLEVEFIEKMGKNSHINRHRKFDNKADISYMLLAIALKHISNVER